MFPKLCNVHPHCLASQSEDDDGLESDLMDTLVASDSGDEDDEGEEDDEDDDDGAGGGGAGRRRRRRQGTPLTARIRRAARRVAEAAEVDGEEEDGEEAGGSSQGVTESGSEEGEEGSEVGWAGRERGGGFFAALTLFLGPGLSRFLPPCTMFFLDVRVLTFWSPEMDRASCPLF